VKARRVLALGMTLTLVVAACGRDDEEPIASSSSQPTDSSGPDTTVPAVVGLDGGGFGDLGVICSPAPEGVELTDSDTGVTADSIQVSTVSDPGFPGRPGLNQELFDTAEAFTTWCNEKGGINGRQIELKERDAILTQFQQRVIEACDEGDFMMVGGGAVFDDTGQVERLACGLPTVAGYVVTAAAAEADLTEQPIPNPANSLPSGDLVYLEEQFPESVEHVAVLTGDLQTTITVAERYKEGVGSLGWEVVYDDQYPANGVASWRPYVESMKSAGATGLIWVGEPVNLGKFMVEAQAVGLELDWVRTDANHYDPKLLDEAGDAADGVYVRSVFAPFLGGSAEAGSASEQYTQLIDQYDEGGVQAYLGVQGLSGWLLFATAARDCGADLTRDCVFEKINAITEWTGGGLHAPVDQTSGAGPDCFNLYTVVDGEFTLAEISPNNGIYNCNADNLITLTGDYGTGAKCPNPAFADDPKPSNCAEA
jgi:Periplasmic binding protein